MIENSYASVGEGFVPFGDLHRLEAVSGDSTQANVLDHCSHDCVPDQDGNAELTDFP
ncbi:uncharacterized protein B0H18DRAFT_1001353 [Fomitopsis serialis]|uniref:uncharacterized protein n=1 Tax=Fomitopsis serialis TaxID=139415 RepID=UPI0020083BE5|nr:uncharacterized protein B0H18DRAFT_1001353 [Neoantrodia serialis]KAH9928091.1 hypothetical protein B0H18DRAFT_1001353 [Neoantrodia serialis]